MTPLLATVASIVGLCTVQTGAELHRTRCRVAEDEQSVVAVPIGRPRFAPDKLDISLEIVTPGYAAMRSLTSGGINSATGELLRERNEACWTARGRRVCLGRAVPRRLRIGRTIPAAFRGAWGLDGPGPDSAHITLGGRRVTDDDGRGWAVTRVADSDGVLMIRGLALDDRETRGDWTVALAPDGELLLLGSPDSLPRRRAR